MLFGEFLDPFETVFGNTQRTFAIFVVFPVCGNTTFSFVVHLLSADLEFDYFASFAYDGGVEGLVTVRFWLCNVVFDFATDWFPFLVDDAESGVTIADGRNNDTEGDEVVDLDNVAFGFEEFFVK